MENRNKKETGEEMTVKKKAYRLLFVEPCMSDKTKKMAEATVAPPPDLSLVRLPGYAADYAAELKLLRLTKGKLSVILFANGTISIRNAENEQHVMDIMEQLIRALYPVKEKRP